MWSLLNTSIPKILHIYKGHIITLGVGLHGSLVKGEPRFSQSTCLMLAKWFVTSQCILQDLMTDTVCAKAMPSVHQAQPAFHAGRLKSSSWICMAKVVSPETQVKACFTCSYCFVHWNYVPAFFFQTVCQELKQHLGSLKSVGQNSTHRDWFQTLRHTT